MIGSFSFKQFIYTGTNVFSFHIYPTSSNYRHTDKEFIHSNNRMEPLFVKRLNGHGYIPKRGSSGAAGYDLYAAENVCILPQHRGLVGTAISIKVPPGTYGRIAPRSGLSVKHEIDVGAGVVDEDYRGEVKILLINNGPTDFHLSEGDRVAQLVLEKIEIAEVREVLDLDSTNRGDGGFGSTGT